VYLQQSPQPEHCHDFTLLQGRTFKNLLAPLRIFDDKKLFHKLLELKAFLLTSEETEIDDHNHLSSVVEEHLIRL
jgi:hypothetical protein